MMTPSPPSGSDGPSVRAGSSSFDLLARPVQHWIWQKGWTELRDIQERAIPAICQGRRDLIIAAATAGGKTEAAFLPLLSDLVAPADADRQRSAGRGFQLLYVSPLKALINDQFRRLDDLCERLEIPVHRWHGDVSEAAKAKARKRPSGVLLITPESVEALFVRRGPEVAGLFQDLRCVVIDELHALLDTERGIHARSLLDRLELAVRARVRRIGLSATFGDMDLTRQYLRPDAPEQVDVLVSDADGAALRIQLRGYVVAAPAARSGIDTDAETGGASGAATDSGAAAHRDISQHLFEKLRGSNNLIFAGSRRCVELYADSLRQLSEVARLPNEFYPHHANLARDHREFVESRLKGGKEPTSAVCTSTLELGIDIGDVATVAQIGAPFSVASLRQRLGRSGRRPGKAAVIRLYIQEQRIDGQTHLLDALRLQTVQSIAMIGLLLERWCEPPRAEAPHLSTLVHQILSLIAERNGACAERLFATLCRRGPFRAVGKGLFARVLRRLGEEEVGLIEQAPDGTLMLGRIGEQLVEHYSFFAVFKTPEEYRLIANGRVLGTLPIEFFVTPEMTLIFSGRRWRVLEVDDAAKTIVVSADPTGQPPRFGGDPADLHDAVVARMRCILTERSVPPYLDAAARSLLDEARQSFHQSGLAETGLIALGEQETLLVPWRGTVATETLALALLAQGLGATLWKIAVSVQAPPDKVTAALARMTDVPDPVALAAGGYNLVREKYHPFLSRDLLAEDCARSRLDATAVPAMARSLLNAAPR